MSFILARTITFSKGQSFHILEAVTLFLPGWHIAPVLIGAFPKSIPWNNNRSNIFLLECVLELKITSAYPHRQWVKIHASMHTWTCTHKTNTYSPAKESPQRGALHAVFTALFNYWLVVFLLLWEAIPDEQGESLAHKNCRMNLSLKPDQTLLTSASLLNRTLAFFGTVSPAWLLILSVFYHYLLLVSFILMFSPYLSLT